MYYANAVDRLMQEGNGIEMVFVIRCSPVPNGPLSYMLGGMSVSAKEYVIGSTLIMYVDPYTHDHPRPRTCTRCFSSTPIHHPPSTTIHDHPRPSTTIHDHVTVE